MLLMDHELKKKIRPEDDPLFEWVNGALRFSLNYSHGGTKQPALTQLMGGGGKGKGLAGLDGAAQAGMIAGELKRLSPLRRAMMIARYAMPTIPCPCGRTCCRGWRQNVEWLDAVHTIANAVLEAGITGNISHFHLRKAMVEKYFGQRVSFVDMAKKCGVSRNTASAQHSKVVEYLKREERLARYEIEGLLKEGGVVGS